MGNPELNFSLKFVPCPRTWQALGFKKIGAKGLLQLTEGHFEILSKYPENQIIIYFTAKKTQLFTHDIKI
jgi:hypothetical protein